jgi:hypothetical protein
MRNQNLFSLPPNLGHQGLLPIAVPTENESKAAAASINEAFNHVDSMSGSLPTETEQSLP